MAAYFIFLLLAATLVAAQNITKTIFLPFAYENNVVFAATVYNYDQDETTYGVQCISGDFATTVNCGPNAPIFTVTEGPSTYIATTTTQFSAASMVVTQSCVLSGETLASCNANILISASGKTTARVASSVFAGPTVAEYYFYNATITTGMGPAYSGGTKNVPVYALGSLVSSICFLAAFVL